ncbi:MAG: NmrA family NAD(P)-binding protein, partial [Pseudomonadota bacterium]
QFAGKGVEIHALARAPEKAKFPDGVIPVKGDLTDVDAMRAALKKASTLFLLNAVTPGEVTQALITLNLAREAEIARIVYFSVMRSDLFTDVPHFTGKYTVERMIETFDLPATILRPAYFMQNDVALKDALLGHSVYPMPVGGVGVSMVDTRDIAEIAALHLLRREQASGALPRETLNLVGPNVLTGAAIAGIWSSVLNRPIRYGGDDVAAFEQRLRAFAPSWMAYDMRLMMSRFQRDGMAANSDDAGRLTALLGRPLRSYRDFAFEAAQQWYAS